MQTVRFSWRAGLGRAFLLAALAATVCRGDVFFRWGKARDLMPMDNIGGKQVYAAPVEINGGRGDLAVVAWDEAYDSVLSKLKRTYFSGADAAFSCGARFSMGILSNASAVVRVMVVDVSGRGLVFTLTQTPAEYGKSRVAPAEQLPGLPVFPGSRPSLQVASGESGAGFELLRTAVAPAEVRSFMDSALRGDGWSPMSGGQAAIYGKGDEICIMLVETSRAGNDTTIALLRRKVARGR